MLNGCSALHLLVGPLRVVPLQLLEEYDDCGEDVQVFQHPVPFQDALRVVPLVRLALWLGHWKLVRAGQEFELNGDPGRQILWCVGVIKVCQGKEIHHLPIILPVAAKRIPDRLLELVGLHIQSREPN